MKRAEITLSGVVQGVGFRHFTVQTAKSYGVKGFVKNLSNGKVYCEAEADRGILKDFIKELKVGPSTARVSDVKVDEFDNLHNYNTFEVKY